MKAILIDPWEKSLTTIDVIAGSGKESVQQLYKLVGEEGLDAAYIRPGESIIVGDHSALANPPLPSYSIEGYYHRLYGKGVVIGFNKDGSERETRLSVDDISEVITWYR